MIYIHFRFQYVDKNPHFHMFFYILNQLILLLPAPERCKGMETEEIQRRRV